MKDIIINSIIIPIIVTISTFLLSNYMLQKERIKEQRKKYFAKLDLICHYLTRISEVNKTIDSESKREIFERELRSEYKGSLQREIIIQLFTCIGENLQTLVELQGRSEIEITGNVKYIYNWLSDIPYKETLQVIHGNDSKRAKDSSYNFDNFIEAVEFILETNKKYYKYK